MVSGAQQAQQLLFITLLNRNSFLSIIIFFGVRKETKTSGKEIQVLKNQN